MATGYTTGSTSGYTSSTSDEDQAVRLFAMDLFKNQGCSVEGYTASRFKVKCKSEGMKEIKAKYATLWEPAPTSAEFGFREGTRFHFDTEYDLGDIKDHPHVDCFALGLRDDAMGMVRVDVVEAEPIRNYILGKPGRTGYTADLPIRSLSVLRQFPCPYVKESFISLPLNDFTEKVGYVKSQVAAALKAEKPEKSKPGTSSPQSPGTPELLSELLPTSTLSRD